MNKREQARADRLFRASHLSNDAQRDNNSCCAFCCVLPAKARTILLALVIAALAVLAPIATGAGTAHAYMSEDKTTAVVADFDELKKAVEGSDGYANVEQIIVDPQAAVDFAENENAQVSYGDGAFYIPIEQPIRVSRPVTITNAEGVQVVFARSARGGNGDLDSRAFAGANEDWPAFFNVINTRGKLTIEGDIVMSGEQVSADFNEADASFSFDVEAKEWSRGNGTGIVDGGYFLHSVSGGEIVVNEGVQITGLTTDSTVKNASPVYLGGGSTYIMNGGAITGNDFGVTAKDVADATTAGAITVEDSKTTANLNEGEISGNVADVAGVFVKEGASLGVTKKFNIDENEIYRVDDAKATEESKDTAPQETTVAPKKSLKGALRSTTPTRGGVTVTTFAELKTAIANGSSPITVDAAFTKGGKNYFPISEPLTVSKNVVIQTKDNKEIIFARTNTFEPTDNKPALFNVVSGGNLTLSEKVTMTGEEITMPKAVKVKLSAGDYYLGKTTSGYGTTPHLVAVASKNSAEELSVDSNGYFILGDGSYVSNALSYGGFRIASVSSGNLDFKVREVVKDDDGNDVLAQGYVTSLVEGKTYVAEVLHGDPRETKYMAYNGDAINKLGLTTNFSNAISFTAEAVIKDGANNVTINSKTGNDAWTATKVLPGGYFIHTTGGGKVTLNSGVLLQNLNTAADVPNAAPVYVGGKDSKLNLAGAEIKNNLVGYAGGDETNSKLMVKDYDKYDIEEFVEGTTQTNSVGGIILDNEAKAEFTSGNVYKNRADVGAILVKNKAELTISGTEEGTTINNNVGFHHAGAVQVESGGKVKMTGGTMSDNVAWYKGGAVWATEWGTNGYADLNWNTYPFPTLENPGDRKEGGYFSMDGGSLKNNMAFKRAGAIEVESNNVYLKSGEISGNTTRSLGGAIYVEGDNTTYTYTLVIENGYIGQNVAVKPMTGGDVNKKINRYLDGEGNLIENDKSSHDHDFSYWGAAGNGGGVWLCPRGGTASFTGQNVIIDNNTKERSGTDLFLQPGYGSVMLQDMKGFWKNESTGVQIATNGVYNGPLPLQNYGKSASGPDYSEPSSGLIIKDNLARDGGGIAANGTVIFGSPKDEFRYDARVNIHKTWDNVPVDQRKDINIQVGYGDPSTDEFNILKTTLIKGTDASNNPQDIELTLDGTSGDIGNYSDAVAGETSGGKNEDQWSGYVTIPAAIDGVALYKFETPEISQLTKIPSNAFDADEIAAYRNKAELDPSKPSDLKYLYYIAKYHPDLLKVKAGTSKIKIKETNTEYDKTYNLNLTVDKIEYTERPTTLIEPASGQQHASFSTCFTSISVGVGVTNTTKAVNVSLIKVATDSTNAESSKKWVRGAKFIVAEIQQDTPSKDFRVAGTPGTWNPDASEEIRTKTILDVAQKDSSGEMAIYTSGDNGVFTIQNLKPDKKYFLFEYEPAAGYVATSSPWIIDVASNGTPTVVAIDPEAKVNDQSVVNKVKTNRPKNNEILDDFIVNDSTNTKNRVWHAYWENSWFYNDDGTAKNPVTNKQIGNSTADIKITKVNNENEPIKNAVFAFADVGYESDKTKVFYSQAGVIRKDGKYLTVASDDNGKIDITRVINALDPTSNGNAGQGRMEADSIWLWMFEIEVSDSYKQKTAPWLINIAKDKTVRIYEYKDPYIYSKSPIQKDDDGNWTWDNAAVNGNDNSQVRNIPLADFNISTNAQNDHPISTSNGTTDAKVKNNKKIKLTKVDGKTGATIPGTKFRLYKADRDIEFDENGNLTSTGAIGVQKVEIAEINAANGTVDIGSPSVGTYLLFETQAATGYERRKEPWLIHVNADGSYRMAIYNYDYLSFYGKKNEGSTTDEWHAKSIKSDAFNSWSKLGGYLDGGKIKYYLKSDKTNRFTELDGNDKGKLKNKPMDLTIVKKSSVGNHALAGVEFDLYNATRAEVPEENGRKHFEFQVNGDRVNSDGQMVSGSNGSFTLPTLEPGHIYMLFEKEPATGYQKPNAPWGIEVDGDGVVKVWRLKKSGDAGYNADSVAQYSADTNPSDVVILCTDMIETGSFEITNDSKPIELQKVDEKGVAVTGSSAQFVITKTEHEDDKGWFIKEGRNHSTSTLTSASQAAFGTAKTVSSDVSTGKLSISGLEDGDYLLFETSAPNGFRRATAPWLIQVRDRADGYTWNIYALDSDHIDKSMMKGSGTTITEQTIAESDQSAYQRWWPDTWFDKTQNAQKLVNEPKYITKVSSTNANGFLEGAKFKIYEAYVQPRFGKTPVYTIGTTSDFHIRKTNTQIGDELVSDSQGRIYLPSSITRTQTVPKQDPDFYESDGSMRYGYLLVETESAGGYQLADKPWWISVDANGNISIKTTNANRHTVTSSGTPVWYTSDFTINCTDRKIANSPGKFSLTKVDKYNHRQKLDGAQFAFYEANYESIGNGIYRYWKKGQTIGNTSVSGSNGTTGEFTLPTEARADVGERKLFIMEEIQAPDGYALSETPWLVGIYREESNSYDYDEAEPYTYYGRTYYRYYKYVVKAWPMDPYGTTSQDDDYVIKGNCDYSSYVENSPSVNLIKVDASTVCYCPCGEGKTEITPCEDPDNPTVYLKDVEFKLYEATVSGSKWDKAKDRNGRYKEAIATVSSKDNGLVELGDLQNGNYLLYEVSNPNKGYVVEEKPWRLVVSNRAVTSLYSPSEDGYDESLDQIYITNSPVYELPKAGGMGTYWFMVIGAMMMAFAATMIFARRRGLIT